MAMNSAYQKHGHVVIIGGSMAGLLAAHVLATYAERVTIVERDDLPEQPIIRAGAPQARHAHFLLARGYAILEALLPGFGRELAALGAHPIDIGSDFAAIRAGVHFPRQTMHIATVVGSRELVEWHLRQRVLAAHDGITLLERHDAIQLVADSAGSICGVQVQQRGTPVGGASETIHADLVVDASGRSSRTPQWLSALGYPNVPITTINSFVGYASRTYAAPTDRVNDWQLLNILSAPPTHPRLGVIMPVERQRWIVTLGGAARDYPPTDEAGFLDFAKSLSSPVLYEAIKDAQPTSPIVGYRQTDNRLVHYERLPRWPDGLILVGDAVCAFNPIYGQGMSNAAIQALVLDRQLTWHRQRHQDGRLRDFAQPFQRQLARANSHAWLLATSEDFRYPTTEGGTRTWSTRQLHWYLDQVMALAATDLAVNRAFLGVLHLVNAPTILFHPRILTAIGRHRMGWHQRVDHRETATEPPTAI